MSNLAGLSKGNHLIDSPNGLEGSNQNRTSLIIFFGNDVKTAVSMDWIDIEGSGWLKHCRIGGCDAPVTVARMITMREISFSFNDNATNPLTIDFLDQYFTDQIAGYLSSIPLVKRYR